MGQRSLLIAVVACASAHLAGRDAAADLTILFTASTDSTGGLPNADGTTYGYSYPNDPSSQNPNLPNISSGVTLTSQTTGLSTGGFLGTPQNGSGYQGPYQVGTSGTNLDGTIYGPSGFNQNAGGTTGWITTTYTFQTGGLFQLIWEVADVVGAQGGDALTTDNIRLDGHLLTSFDSGIPSNYSTQGSVGTSGSIPLVDPSTGTQAGTLSPTSGTAFGYLDVQDSGSPSNNVAPLFDTSGDVYSASQLYSASFTVQAGDTLSLDVAFLTNDGSPYADYGIVAVAAVVPEPSNLLVAAVGILGMVGYAAGRRLQAGRGRAERRSE
jgi:hypothetical protein